MGTTRKIGNPTLLHSENLLERALIARPDAGIEDVRSLAPLFRDVPDAALEDQLSRVRQRIAAKRNRRK